MKTVSQLFILLLLIGLNNAYSQTVITYLPINKAVGVPTNAKLRMVFSEPMVAGDGNINIYEDSNKVKEVKVKDKDVEIIGNVVTIDPKRPFKKGAKVYVLIEKGAFKALLGNREYEGISDEDAWTFTIADGNANTADEEAPVVEVFSPANGTADIPVDTKLVMTFNESVKAGSGKVTLHYPDGGTQVLTMQEPDITISGSIVTITPTDNLPPNATVYVEVDEGLVEDEENNPFAGIDDATTWRFTTAPPEDQASPAIVIFSPANNADSVRTDVNLVITFNEDVKKNKGTITINGGESAQVFDVSEDFVRAAGNTVIINPPQNFPPETDLHILIEEGAFTDLSDNEFAGIDDATIWRFTTASPPDEAGPVAKTLTPPDNAANIAADAVLEIVFDEEIKKGTGKITINQGASSQVIDVASENVSVKGDVATITPPDDFPEGAEVFIQIEKGAFADLADNEFAGIADAVTWNFTVRAAEDKTAPTANTLSPANNATGVAVDADLVITFSEKIKKGTGNILISQNGVVQPVDVNSDNVVVRDEKATIALQTDFISGATVTIQIPAGAFTDLADNPFAGIEADAWKFTVADDAPPAIALLSPLNGGKEVAPTAKLVITFTEEVAVGTGKIIIDMGERTQEIDVDSSAVTIDGAVVTIVPPEALPLGADVFVQIEKGAFIDKAGNEFAGIADETTWQFSVTSPADKTAPEATSFFPAKGGEKVALNSSLIIAFNEGVKKGTGKIILTYGETRQEIDVNSAAVSVAGSGITINPPQDFPEGKVVKVLIDKGAFTDLAGNAYEGITDDTTWNFTTVDNTAPLVDTFSPADGATRVGVADNLVITFNEDVKAATGTITIFQGTNNQTINAGSQAVTIAGNKVTINPPADFPEKAAVYIQITEGTFTDLANNKYTGINNDTDWLFTTEDKTDPVATVFSPENESVDVEPDAVLSITFSEEIKKGTGKITINQGASSQVIDVASENVSVKGDVATITPPDDFPEGAEVFIQIEKGAFADLADNEFAGIADDTEWKFIIVDKTAPVAAKLAPANNASAVAVDADLVITFNEEVEIGTGKIIINQNGKTQEIEVNSNAVSVAGAIVTINPPQDFPENASIHVLVEEGTFADKAGNVFEGITSNTDWHFTIEDKTPPAVKLLSPANKSVGVEPDAVLSITFSEAIKKGAGKITINQGASSQVIDVTSENVSVEGDVATITPPDDFPESANVYVLVESGAFTDLAGNAFTRITERTTWTFSIREPVDTTAPAIASFSPANNATAVAVNADLIITFNEEVEKGTGKITVNQAGNTQEIDINSDAVSIAGAVATINLPADLPENATIAVQIEAGAFKDKAENIYAGINNDTGWRFTTEDKTAPVVAELSPANNAVEVASDVSLIIRFSEEVKKGNGTITIFQGTGNQTVNVNNPAVTVSGNTVTIDPPVDFTKGTTLYIQLTKGIFTDLAGNEYAGIADNTSWTFSTVPPSDEVAPTISSFTPPDNAADVAADTDLAIVFDEKMKKGTGIITLYENGAAKEQIDVASPAVMVAEQTVAFKPATAFTAGAAVYVQIAAGAFTDTTGNAFAGITDPASWNFTIAVPADITPPSVAVFSPANNAIDIKADENLIITFDEPVKAGQGKIKITQGETLQEIDVTTNAVTIDGAVVTINPPQEFMSGATVVIQIERGAFTDEQGNVFAGIDDAITWSFRIVQEIANDETPPVVESFYPLSSATDIDPEIDLKITFNEDVQKNQGNIIINQGSDKQEINVNSNAVAVDGKSVTIDPPRVLPQGVNISVEIPAGAFVDTAGNEYAGLADPAAWSFRTAEVADEAAPVVSVFSPTDDAADVPTDTPLTMIFDEVVAKGAGVITLYENGAAKEQINVTSPAVTVADSTVSITPAAEFAAGAAIYVLIEAGAFTDTTGNEFAGIADAGAWNFAIAAAEPTDSIPPTVTAFSPADNETEVPVNTTDLVITFDENILAATGKITIFENAVAWEEIDAGSDAVTITAATATIKPSKTFTTGADVHILIEAGTFTDTTGNAFAGINNNTIWNFKVEEEETPVDSIAPTVSTLSPENGAVEVTADAQLVLTFDEDVQAGSGSITINQGADSQTIAVTDAAVSITANTVTITPPQAFPAGASISVAVPAGAFADTTGNEFAGILASDWSFTIQATTEPTDSILPTVSRFAPADNATEVATDAPLVITFDEVVVKGAGVITLYENGAAKEQIDVASPAVSLTDSTVSITPAAGFAAGAAVYILIEQGAFTDTTGNAYAGIADAATWNFATVAEETPTDSVAPIVTAFSPENGAVEVATDADLALTFDENIVGTSGKIIITQNGVVLEEILANSSLVSITNDQVSINPGVDFTAGATIDITIEAGAFTDTTGNEFAGMSDWNFTIEKIISEPVDSIAPTVTTFTPADDAAEVAANTALTMVFDEVVAKGAGVITLYENGAAKEQINSTSPAVTVADSTVSITPAAEFAAGAAVYVLIEQGAFTDTTGNAFAGIADAGAWNFAITASTAPVDSVAPTVSTLSPENGAVEVTADAQLVLTFDEDVQAGSGSITINQGADSQTIAVTDAAVNITANTVTITPPQAFPAGASISVAVPAGAFADTTGNEFAGILASDWSFTIQATTEPTDSIPPTVTAFSPENGAVEVNINVNLTMIFDEEVQAGTGNIVINQGDSIQEIDVTSNAVTVDGNTVTINPPQDFPAGTTISVQMPSGTFTDTTGNAYAGIADAATWSFTTTAPVADITPPTITALSPPDNATDVAANVNLVITFSEEVKKGVGNIIINQGMSTQIINVESDFVTVAGNTVVIDVPEDFPSGASVNVLMLSGVFTDLSNNSFLGITDADVWNFSVPDDVAPQITAFFPEDNTTDVPANINLVMIFDENIQKGTGNITIVRDSTTVLQVIDVNSADVKVSGTTAIINPPEDLPGGAVVSVLMPAGVFTDVANNNYEGITDAATWNLTIAGFSDTSAPEVTQLSPADDATEIAASANLVMTFNENIQKGTGNIIINQGGTTQTIDVASDAVSIEGTMVTIDPPEDLPGGADVYIQMPASVFTDQANNPYQGISDAASWNFTVETPDPVDEAAPLVQKFSPADNATGVNVKTNLVITFNESVKKGSGNITINQGNTSQVINVSSNAVTINGAEITINPPQDFPANTAIAIQMPAGVFKDQADNDFAGINNATTWNFTTAPAEDTAPPTVSGFSPANNATEVAANANLVITFNENIKKGQGILTVNFDNSSQEVNVNSNAVSVAANKVTVNLPEALPDGANVHILIDPGTFTDLAGNAYAGIADATVWSFTIAASEVPTDTIPPVVSVLSPADNATEVATDAPLVITFDEVVVKGAGVITLYENGAAKEQIDVASPAVSLTDSTVSITPAAGFAAGAAVYILIEQGAFTDTTGNVFAGIADTSTWNFTIADPVADVPPAISTLSPANNATNVAAATNLVITFTEAVKKGTGAVSINYNNETQTIDVGSNNVTVSGATVTINPPADLPAGAVVNVQMPAGIFTDQADNPFAGITDATTWTFTVVESVIVDNEAPVWVALSPANSETDVVPNTDLIITFNEPVKRGTGKITLNLGGRTEEYEVTSPSVTVEGNTVTIDPPQNLPFGATVSVLMPAGVFEDLAGNDFAGFNNATPWSFTVASILPIDNTPPVIRTYSPPDEATDVAVNASLIFTFNEAVQKGSGNITINSGNDSQIIDVNGDEVTIAGATVTVNPPNDFPVDADVDVQMSAGTFRDAAGNTFAGILNNTTWNFKVIRSSDTIAPVITTLSPADNSEEIEPNANLVITFSETVKKATGTIIIYQGNTTQTIDVNSDAVTVAGNTVTIDPPEDFPSGASISILMLPGLFTDEVNNSFAGIIDAAAWNFTVKDNIAPTVTSFYPADDATNVPSNVNLVMTFSEEIKKGNGNIVIEQGNDRQTINVKSENVIVSGATVIINPPADFPLSANIHVQMPAGTFTDTTDNAYAGITDTTTWNMTIAGFADTNPPTITTLFPSDNATRVAANADLVMVFNENIQKGTGIIIINQGASSQEVNVESDAVTINGTTVTIKPSADFPLSASVYVQVPAGAFVDVANNPFAGITDPATWNFAIDEEEPVIITAQNFPDVIQSNAANVDASIEVNRIQEDMKVEFVSRGIAQEVWSKKEIASASLKFSTALERAQFDEIGLEYYFNITLPSGTILASDTGYTYIQYTGAGLDIPDLKFGTTVDAYQMISVPLDLQNKDVSAVLEDNLGEYNIKQWRFAFYRDTLLQEYKNGFTAIETGQSYWLIIRNNSSLNTGEGTTVRVKQSNPYTLNLKKGWNQIGNPYNFNVSWKDVKAFNQSPEGLGNLRIFDTGIQDSDMLKKFGGAYVFVEEDMAVKLPVRKNKTVNGRLRAEEENRFNPSSLWEVNFTVQTKELSYGLGGLGMNEKAKPSKDGLDDITVPRFNKYLEVNFRHPEYFAPKFTKDMMPVEENHMWEFTVESNFDPQQTQLSWHHYLSAAVDKNKKFMLFDVQQNKLIDLQKQAEYSFWLDKLATFRLYYGDPQYIAENFKSFQSSLGDAYPNPFNQETTVEFILSALDPTYDVQLEVHNLVGQAINTLAAGEYKPGAYTVTWDGRDAAGNRLPPGMYMIRMVIISDSGKDTFIKKVIYK